MEKAREHQIDLYMCFIDCKKAFDCVDQERLWVILRDGSASTPDSETHCHGMTLSEIEIAIMPVTPLLANQQVASECVKVHH